MQLGEYKNVRIFKEKGTDASLLFFTNQGCNHKKRIHTEEKAKVVAADWGIELIDFLAALAILYQDDLKNRMISS